MKETRLPKTAIKSMLESKLIFAAGQSSFIVRDPRRLFVRCSDRSDQTPFASMPAKESEMKAWIDKFYPKAEWKRI